MIRIRSEHSRALMISAQSFDGALQDLVPHSDDRQHTWKLWYCGRVRRRPRQVETSKSQAFVRNVPPAGPSRRHREFRGAKISLKRYPTVSFGGDASAGAEAKKTRILGCRLGAILSLSSWLCLIETRATCRREEKSAQTRSRGGKRRRWSSKRRHCDFRRAVRDVGARGE